MSAGPANPVDRLEQAAKQFKNSGVIQLAVQGLLLEGVARDLRRCDAATVGCVELSAWLNRGDTRARTAQKDRGRADHAHRHPPRGIHEIHEVRKEPMNNDTGGDHPMPGTRMRRLFDENLSMIETMTRIEIRRLGRMPRGTHLGQDDGNPVTDLLPDRYLDRYDREFLYRMLGSTIRLRARLADPKTDHAAHSVIEEILISRAVRLVADDDNEEGSGLEAWLEDWLGDLDVDRLYDPAADEATLASDPATGSGDMRFDHWFEDQYWADETDGGE